LAREAEQDAAVFTQAANIDKLVSMLQGLDPAKDNLADNEEIQVGALPSGINWLFTSFRNFIGLACHYDQKLSS